MTARWSGSTAPKTPACRTSGRRRMSNALILRDADADSGSGGNLGISGSHLEQRLYVQQDANYNVTAIMAYNASSSSWTVAERKEKGVKGSFHEIAAWPHMDGDVHATLVRIFRTRCPDDLAPSLRSHRGFAWRWRRR